MMKSPMDWERVNVWTNTVYALIHSIHIAREKEFGDLASLDGRVRESASWVQPDCSYASSLLDHKGGRDRLRFRRDPNKHFEEISRQVIKMLIQDLVVILDQMMDEALEAAGEKAGPFPQSKVEKLRAKLGHEYQWAADGCLELIAARNVFTHARGVWTERTIRIITFLKQPPAPGDILSIGVTMLFRYRKAMRTFLNEIGWAVARAR
jgi:hypothetical protein